MPADPLPPCLLAVHHVVELFEEVGVRQTVRLAERVEVDHYVVPRDQWLHDVYEVGHGLGRGERGEKC